MLLTLVARSGNRRASATATRMSPIVSGLRSRVRMTLARASRRSSKGPVAAGQDVEVRVAAHEARDHRREQSLLIGEARVDRLLSGRGRLRDLLDARALEAALEKHAARRVQDSLLDLSGKLARRTPAARGARLSGGASQFHGGRAPSPEAAIVKIGAHVS